MGIYLIQEKISIIENNLTDEYPQEFFYAIWIKAISSKWEKNIFYRFYKGWCLTN